MIPALGGEVDVIRLGPAGTEPELLVVAEHLVTPSGVVRLDEENLSLAIFENRIAILFDCFAEEKDFLMLLPQRQDRLLISIFFYSGLPETRLESVYDTKIKRSSQ